MKTLFTTACLTLLMAGAMTSCQKSTTKQDQPPQGLSPEEKTMIVAAGFNGNWAERTADGNYLIEGDILLSSGQLTELSGVVDHDLIVANEEHYRTTRVVSTPTSGQRTITVQLGSGFPSYFSTGLDQALARYNGLNLKIRLQRVSSGADIVITGRNLGTTSTGGCILGQASGFPSGSGNPASGFTLSTSSCALNYLNTANKADEVMAHEIGHCIGFRHTDYMNRSSCGQNANEGSAGVGAVHIPGTPTVVSGNYNSWMMACTNGSPTFSSADGTALQYVY